MANSEVKDNLAAAPDAGERELADHCFEVCVDLKGENIRLYDMSGKSILADYFLVCSANSGPQLRALSARLQQEMQKFGRRPLSVDGTPDSQWMLLDYGIVLIHLFHPETRDYYRIEQLWDGAVVCRSA